MDELFLHFFLSVDVVSVSFFSHSESDKRTRASALVHSTPLHCGETFLRVFLQQLSQLDRIVSLCFVWRRNIFSAFENKIVCFYYNSQWILPLTKRKMFSCKNINFLVAFPSSTIRQILPFFCRLWSFFLFARHLHILENPERELENIRDDAIIMFSVDFMFGRHEQNHFFASCIFMLS